mmetsp:Transcript_4893/g.13342  ORF Transcript_4893/g.13342 Transcript_4893/m.13342 type:complete len:268 (+) Transcript_4893:864-1667(+)
MTSCCSNAMGTSSCDRWPHSASTATLLSGRLCASWSARVGGTMTSCRPVRMNTGSSRASLTHVLRSLFWLLLRRRVVSISASHQPSTGALYSSTTSGVNFSGLYHARGLATSPISDRSSGLSMLRPSFERASRRVMEGPRLPDRSGCRSASPMTRSGRHGRSFGDQACRDGDCGGVCPPPPPAATCGFLYRALLTRNITAPPLLPPLPATLPPAPAFSQLSAAALAHTAVCVPSGARISPEGCAVAVDEAKPGGERLLVQFADGLEG